MSTSGGAYHHIITVCADADANCRTSGRWPIGDCHWSVDDPAVVEGSEEERLAAYRPARDELSDLIDRWLAEIGGSR
jgi:arsenate reductase